MFILPAASKLADDTGTELSMNLPTDWYFDWPISKIKQISEGINYYQNNCFLDAGQNYSLKLGK